MQIDHIIYAHPDLDAGVAEIEDRFGVRATGGGRHPGQGTHNRLLALGPRTYLEIIAPDPGQPEVAGPLPYGVEGISHGQVVGWAIACDDIDTAVARARSRDFDPLDVRAGQRTTATGMTLRWRLTGNALTAGPIPFLISWGETPHPAADAPGGLVLLDVYLEHPDPGSLGTALAALDAAVDVRPAAEPAIVAVIDGPLGVRELR